jgi:recombinase-like zinc beta ribbon protein
LELSGGLLRCPECGRALVAVLAWKGYTRKNGTRKRHFHYACGTRRQRGKEACSYSRTPNARKIEAEVWEAVKAVLLDPERLERGLNAYLEAARENDGGTQRRRLGYSRTGSPRSTARGPPTKTWWPRGL